jgi:hypothetical protein
MIEKVNIEKAENDNSGKDFMESFKSDSDFGKEFFSAFNKDLRDFKGPQINYFSRPDTPPLTDEEKAKMKEETGWPDEIIDSIATWEEYEIYKKAGLQAVEINGKWCLIRNDIDWDQQDENGLTNRERVEKGLSPINKDGKVIELHHIGQKADSPFAELTKDEHRGKGNDVVLHDKNQESETHNEENESKYQNEKKDHWKARVGNG